MSPGVTGLLCVACVVLSILAVISAVYDFRWKRHLKPQPSAPGPAGVEREKRPACLKGSGDTASRISEEEHIIAKPAAWGLVRKEGDACAHAESRDEHNPDQESTKPGAPPGPAETERKSAALAPVERWKWGRWLLLAIPVAALASLLGWYWHAFSGSPSADAIFRRTSPAVVQVVIQDRQGRVISGGSGFVVSNRGLIATNYHVIEDAHAADVVLPNETRLRVVGAAALDEEADIAIIKVAGQIDAQPLELTGDDLPPVGARVYAIGSPLGSFTNTLSDGLVSGHREGGSVPHFPRLPTMIQTTAPISHGSSGGPLLRDDGKVVGVMTLTFSSEGENLNFAVPAPNVARLLSGCEGEGQLTRLPLIRQPDAHAYLHRGNALFGKGEFDQAIEAYSEAIRLDPDCASAYEDRGYTWSLKGDYARAIRDYDHAIRLDPNDPGYYWFRGSAWLCKQDYDKAIRDCDQAIRLDPKNACYYYDRGLAWSLKKDYDRAIRDYGEAIRLAPHDASYYFSRGGIWDDKQDYDRAIRDYDQAIRLDPKEAAYYYFRGGVWQEKQDYDRAIRDYDQAIRLDPNYESAYTARRLAWQLRNELRR